MKDLYTHKTLDMLQLSKIRQMMTPIPHKTPERIWGEMLEYSCIFVESGTGLTLEAYDQSEYYAGVSRYTYSYTLWSVGIGRKLFRLHMPARGFPLTAVRIMKNGEIPENVKITSMKQLHDYMRSWMKDPFVKSMVERANPRELTEDEACKCVAILERFRPRTKGMPMCAYISTESVSYEGYNAVKALKRDLWAVVGFDKNTELRDVLSDMKYSKLDRDITHDSLLPSGSEAIRCFMKDILKTWKEGEAEKVYHEYCTK